MLSRHPQKQSEVKKRNRWLHYFRSNVLKSQARYQAEADHNTIVEFTTLTVCANYLQAARDRVELAEFDEGGEG